MNLQNIANSQITSVNPNREILVLKWKDQKNVNGKFIAIYEDPIKMSVQIQPTSDSVLQRIDPNINKAKIHKTFWIPSDNISGLDYFENKDRDMIVLDGYKYRIIHEYDNYETGWKVLVGAKGEKYVGK